MSAEGFKNPNLSGEPLDGPPDPDQLQPDASGQADADESEDVVPPDQKKQADKS